MADDKHYVPGTFYRICDMTGFKVRSFRTKKQWNNIIVRDQSWEARQPQDFVRGVRDEQNAPEPRPRAVNTFLGPLMTSILTRANIGDTTIYVDNTGRMYASDVISIVLDNGECFRTTVIQVPSSTELVIHDPLPWSTSFGNEVTDWSAVSPPNINSTGSAGDD